jgi:O-methyltransferase involved in polyketide biosynthesis
MSDLDDIQIGDWLMIVSTMKGSSYILQQVTSTTSGLVRTRNYTFRRDGRSFSVKQRSVTARLATESEIESWLSGRKKQETQKRMEPSEEVVLAQYLAAVSEEEWARLGVAQLKKIKIALNERTGSI